MLRRASFAVTCAFFNAACASSDPVQDAQATAPTGGGGQIGSYGGGLGVGGSIAAGGSVAAGSTPSVGGALGSGGDVATGGSESGGGGTATGGAGGSSTGAGGTGTGGSAETGGAESAGGSGNVPVRPVKYVFVVTMENHDGTSVYGNTTSAPYINGTLVPKYSKASSFTDPLPLSVPSEPHYVWMEAGTNVFSDYTFTSDDDPSASNSTASTDHLSTQIDAKGGLSWLAYQEGIDSNTGACPIHTSGFYAPKHDPFVFFQDVSGSPPSDTNAYCTDHHRPLSSLAQDLGQTKVARYNFITPNLCNDMHGQFGCPSIDLIKPGDDWLAANIPALESFCNANDGVVFVVWDEGEGSTTMPFLAIGPGVKSGYSSNVTFTHSSLVKSVEEIFGLPILATVTSANDFADVFKPGAFP